MGVREKRNTDHAIQASGEDRVELQSPYVQEGVCVESAQGWTGCGAYHEARWVGEPGYGVEVYEKCEV